jgi:hypothetical protein
VQTERQGDRDLEQEDKVEVKVGGCAADAKVLGEVVCFTGEEVGAGQTTSQRPARTRIGA